VPNGSATTDDQWAGFKVEFTESYITVYGFPSGAAEVWPIGYFSINDNLTQITRAPDGVVMLVDSLTATELDIRFTVPDRVVLTGTKKTLSGEYNFKLN
jgi:hypothetical protein